MSLRRSLKHYRYAIAGSTRLIPVHLVSVVLTALIAASPPLLVGLAIDHIGQELDQQLLLVALGLLLGAGLLYLGLCFLRDHLVTVIAERAGCAFGCRLYEHLQRLSADFYQINRIGEVTARLTHDVNRGVRPLYRHLVDGVSGGTMLITASVCLLWYSPALFGMFAILTAISFGLGIWALPRIHRNFQKLQDDNGELNAQITEAVSVHSLVRAFARESEARARMQPLIEKLARQQVRAERFLWKFLVFIWSFELLLGPLLTLLVGAWLLHWDTTTAGSLAAALLYWRQAAEFKWRLTGGITGVMSGMGALSRATAFFDETPLVADSPGSQDLEPGAGAIAMHSVRFRYPHSRDDFALHDISLHIPAGSRCALLGASGSGKSTIAQLLCRIYDPEAGHIAIDGHDIRTVRQHSLRQRIGFMTQETLLFDGSLRDNLRFADPQAEDARLLAVLAEAELGDFVAQLPDGLETRIGERGIRLSGGQRQRLAIARLLLLDPSIVILDEATSALDASTETAIWRSIDRLFAGRTQLLITHRLASALHADRIVVVQQGRIVDQGSATDLFERCELFQRFCEAQHISPGVLA